MQFPRFARIVIDPAVERTATAAAIRRNARGAEIVVAPTAQHSRTVRHAGLTGGKRHLLVEAFHGRAMKVCQGLKPDYACCNLHTLAEANNCTMECTYCILQYYMTSPHLSVFANVEDLQAEIATRVASQPRRLHRIGTGELSDSLLLDPLTESTTRMVPFFRRLPNAILELKTKTDNVDRLLTLDHGERTVVSWSVNPPAVVERDELKTASLAARLDAARRVADCGYPVGFHLDPMILHDGWEDGYRRLLGTLLEAVPLERIAWISLGSLRFPPEMKPTMERRFPRSSLPLSELVRGEDGKLRYLRPLRVAMYRTVVGRFDELWPRGSPAPTMYLCMEPPEVWRKVFAEDAPTPGELDYRFAASFATRFRGASFPAARRADYVAGTPHEPEGQFVPVDSIESIAAIRARTHSAES